MTHTLSLDDTQPHKNLGWTRLEQWELNTLPLPTSEGTKYALLDNDEYVRVVGQLLMQLSDGYWLVQPVNGDVQLVFGFPAKRGNTPKALLEDYLYCTETRKSHLFMAGVMLKKLAAEEVARTKLAKEHGVKSLGKFSQIVKCTKCEGFECRDVWVETEGKKEELMTRTDLFLISLADAQSVLSYIRSTKGICMCY